MKQKRVGFTLVELLIVIVVIGILAGLVIVAFSGLNRRAVEVLVADDMRKSKSLLELERINNGAYPQSLLSTIGNDKLDYQYTVSADGQTYCLTSMHKTLDDTAYHVDDSGIVAEGACSGHYESLSGGSSGGGGVELASTQRAAQCCGTGQQTVTLGAAPTPGNLMIATIGWVSTTVTTASLSGSGWQTANSTFDTTWSDHYGLLVLWKVAGPSEPTSYTATTSGASTSNNLMIQEFATAGSTVGAPSTSFQSSWGDEYLSSGTATATADNSLAVATSINRRGVERVGGLTWSEGLTDPYTSDHDSHVTLSTAWMEYDQPGSYSIVATWGDTQGSFTTSVATVGLMVFPLN